MHTPPSPSQDEIMAEVFGVTPEEFRISELAKQRLFDSMKYALHGFAERELAKFRTHRPGWEKNAPRDYQPV